ncbi:cation-translocating P-type ATPase [Salinisphaera sp. RV14]|uniref:cation-translocating P-type ATPase n=1 Tax=Salinisphaera sp. RV14 TaxID=3454140 RepID=UPI003F8687E1
MDSSNWHELECEHALQALETAAEGLSPAQVQARLVRYGENSVPIPPPESALRRLGRQFRNLLICVLMSAGVATLFLRHWVDSGVIFGVVLIMVLIGAFQEGRAEKALRAIQALLSLEAIVIRAGRLQRVPTREIVPGDIVRLNAGDCAPADLRLLRAHQVRVDESPLTGESAPVAKSVDPVPMQTPLAERSNMVYSGTHLTQGRAIGIVIATGARTEIGRIARLAEDINETPTPLMVQMSDLSLKLTVGILLLAIVTFGIGWLGRSGSFEELFLAAVALAVAAIPEGLPAVITITLAIGVQRMARRNAIIRRLYAVETLGAVDVICSDKTGTLTYNQMMVRCVVLAGDRLMVDGDGYAPMGTIQSATHRPLADVAADLARLLTAAVLCNEAELKSQPDWHVVGSATEGALLTLATKAGQDVDAIRAAYRRLDIMPFESESRFMATLHRDQQDTGWITLKGAPESVVVRCTAQMRNGLPEPLDANYWTGHLTALADTGQRTLAIAQREVAHHTAGLRSDDLDSDLVLLGLVGIQDPPRPEAIEAVQRCRAAGIDIKMITGDHAATARAIGAQFGLGQTAPVLSGTDIDAMDEQSLQESTRTADVYARTTPEHKLRLVRALQARGCIVAMTGDGVNDAPALKQAEVGIAMGRRGTDTARQAAHVILTDDNFVSIADAVEQGRTVYDNIRKSVLYIMPTGLAEAMVVVLATLFGLTLPLTPLQILWVNTITATTLGLALAFEQPEQDLMRRRPRGARDAIVNGLLVWRIVFVTLVIVAGTFAQFIYAIDRSLPLDQARTVAVNTLVMFEIFYLFSSRFIVNRSLSWQGFIGNRYVPAAAVATLALQALFTYAPPLQLLFDTRGIGALSWIGLTLTASSVLFLVEIEKAILRYAHKDRGRPVTTRPTA